MRVAATWALAACLPLTAANLWAQSPPAAPLPSTTAPTPADEATLPPVTVTPSEDYAEPSDGGDYGNYGNNPGYGRSGYNPGAPIGWDSNAITSDQQLVGPYNQPVWTTQRPFATTRSYVLPAGTFELSQWVRPTWNEGEPVEFRMLEEVAIGLPNRFQLDLYERWNIEDEDHNASHEGVQIELRYALADWGVIPLNPTLYAEWVERGGPQEKPNKYELKFLMADTLIDNWYYASNLILEQETSATRETELGWSNALSTTVIDRVLLAGFECTYSSTNEEGARSQHADSFLIGPSIQIRPTNRSFIDLVALGGTTPRDESPLAQMYVIVGWQFGTRAAPSGGYAGGPASSYINGPASTRGN